MVLEGSWAVGIFVLAMILSLRSLSSPHTDMVFNGGNTSSKGKMATVTFSSDYIHKANLACGSATSSSQSAT